MLYLYTGIEMEKKYHDRMVYDADTYFLWDTVSEFSQEELNAIKAIDGATYVENGLFKSKIFGAPLHFADKLSMGCRMLLNLIRNTKKDEKDVYDMTNAGPNVIKYLLQMPRFGKDGEDRYIFMAILLLDELPPHGIYVNDVFYDDYDKFYMNCPEV